MYTERMLQISDNVPLRECGGRMEHKRIWMLEGRRQVWEECASLQEFARRANLSEGKARELNKAFASVSGKPPLSKERSLPHWMTECLGSISWMKESINT